MRHATEIQSRTTQHRRLGLRPGLLMLSLIPVVSCAVATGGLRGTDERFMDAAPDVCRASGAWDLNGRPLAIPKVARCVVTRYPSSLRDIGEEGEVRVRFLVDSAGISDSSSIRVVKLVGDLEFARAVLVATPFLRFTPAPAGSLRPIVVEMPTTFTITH